MTIQNADQSLLPPGFGPVVDGLVADLQHLANIHHVASLVQYQQTQRPAAKVAKAVAPREFLQSQAFFRSQSLVQQVAFTHGRIGRERGSSNYLGIHAGCAMLLARRSFEN